MALGIRNSARLSSPFIIVHHRFSFLVSLGRGTTEGTTKNKKPVINGDKCIRSIDRRIGFISACPRAILGF